MTNQAADDGATDALWQKIRTEGVELAYATAIGICRDPNAPAPAKATALTALFRVAGYFTRPDTGQVKEPHEMNAEELSANIRQLRTLAREATKGVFD